MKFVVQKKYSFLLLAAIMVLVPLLIMLVWSFSQKWMYPAIWPQQIGNKMFKQMLNDPNFYPAICNSFLIAFATTVVSLFIALPAAKYFAFQRRLSQRLVEVLIYLPLILPAIAVITSSQVLFLQLRLTGTFLGVILLHTYLCLPYAMQVLIESYRQLGEGYELTAQSLGAKPGTIFRQITWPLLRPGVSTAAMLVFIVSFSQYLPTFFIGGGRIVTLPLLLLPYANNGRFGLASAYSLIFLVSTMIGVLSLKKIIGGKPHGTKR
ncbi:ABC transporter permease subunit [Enterococcus pseudoavium]|uniref:ABC transporter permease subunit n=1 Tax=Enterococcus pseudoavium TaxID=44007 RepID=A0AAE4I4J2_9ENTE|nr:ABC transporter permease subunit [Enterococcus pseudoavium]MDT2738012.1 ABC transporter permease subunit [Enterococcus pseudoavium]